MHAPVHTLIYYVFISLFTFSVYFVYLYLSIVDAIYLNNVMMLRILTYYLFGVMMSKGQLLSAIYTLL